MPLQQPSLLAAHMWGVHTPDCEACHRWRPAMALGIIVRSALKVGLSRICGALLPPCGDRVCAAWTPPEPGTCTGTAFDINGCSGREGGCNLARSCCETVASTSPNTRGCHSQITWTAYFLFAAQSASQKHFFPSHSLRT